MITIIGLILTAIGFCLGVFAWVGIGTMGAVPEDGKSRHASFHTLVLALAIIITLAGFVVGAWR